MKRTLTWILITCFAITLTACGTSNHIPKDVDPDTVAGMFHGIVITKDQVEYQRKIAQLYPEALDANLNDKEIVDAVVRGLIMVEEAERLGLEATQEEITETIRSQREIYDTYPTARENVDYFCDGMDISLEEFFERMETELYATASKQKLRDEYGREYCKKKGIEFTKVNPPLEMIDYIDEKTEALIDKHKDDVVYYIDTNT